jgi:hypothetical protein
LCKLYLFLLIKIKINKSTFNIQTFLEEYQRFPCLWFKSDPEYKLRNKHDFAEEKLLESTGLDSVKKLKQ